MQAPVAVVTPRVNKASLGNFIGHTVRLVGKVSSISKPERVAMLETSDKQQVKVRMLSNEYPAAYIEIVGTVNGDLSITETYAYVFGDNFDFDNYDKLITLTDSYPEIFGGAGY